MSKTYHLDYETRSHCDLPKCGGWRYAFDPTTEILCIGIAEEEGEPVVWTPWSRDERAERMMRDFANPETVIYAHNATGFEVPVTDALFTRTTGLKAPQHHQWRCTAAMGRRAALPASLKRLAEALKLTNQKDDKGAGLIRKFSIPNAKTSTWVEPEEDWEAFQQFCDYCRQDVKVEQEIHQKLKAFELKGFPLQVFQLDLEINARGFPVNLDALRNAEVIVEKESAVIAKQFEALTGLSPNQNAKFLAWLKDRGYERENLQAGTLEEVLEEEDFDPASEIGRALLLKKRISFASLKKIPAMLACAGPHDNRVRGTLTYHGAGTGRWSASLVQPQNFKTPPEYLEKVTEEIYRQIAEGYDGGWIDMLYAPALEAVSSCIRHFIHDVDGGPMLDADYSAIEARALAWQANEQWRLDVFNNHGMIYEASASEMFKVPLHEFSEYKEKNGKHHPLRKKGKVAELACIAEGQLVLTDYGRVPIEEVSSRMKVFDGYQFVDHSGVVYQGEKMVVTYQGLTATTDHIVFTDEGPIPLIEAMQKRVNLLGEHPEGYNFSPRLSKVYDILNCGPNNRFVVSGVLVHNCGYRGGPGAMEKMGALKQGLTKKELPGIVKAWREASPNVCNLWNDTENAAIQAVRNPMKKIPFGVRCHFFTAKAAGMDYLFMQLPSGRKIAYPEPRLEKMLTWKIETKVVLPDGTEDVELSWKKMLNPTAEQIATIRRKHPDAKLKDALTFYGQLPKTVNWGRVATHGGVLVENLCQGVCADFMAHGAINASREGYEICALIHDEALAYYHPKKGQSLEEFVSLLTDLPSWAEGMPLNAEGDVVKFYKK
jgi:DNA polymerase